MTRMIEAAGRSVASSGTELIGATAKAGPVSLEGHYDDAMSVFAVMEEIHAGERGDIDGYVIACFSDPGLLAAREIATGPVVGCAEAAMHAASFVATGFSIVTTPDRTRIIAERLVREYGMENYCKRVRTIDMPVLELQKPKSKARERVLAECEKAIIQDGSGAIVLGCAGLADLVKTLELELHVPVVDGVAAAVKFTEALVGLNLATSKRGDLAYPVPKKYTGALNTFSPKSSFPNHRDAKRHRT